MAESSSDSSKTVVVITSLSDIASKLNAIIAAHKGRVHQQIGQLSVLIFSSAKEACEATIALQQETTTDWKGGIAHGEFTTALEEATRMESAVRNGEIAIAPSLLPLLNDTSVTWISVGKRQFAGTSEAIELNVIGRILSREKKEDKNLFDLPIDLLLDAKPTLAPKMEDDSLVRIASKIAAGASRIAPSDTIELAEESPHVTASKKIPLRSPAPPIEPKERLGDRLKRLILLLLISIGTAMLAKNGMKWLDQKDPYDRETEVKKRLEGSDVLQSMNRKRPKAAPLPPRGATLAVRSSPPGAEVWIDNVRINGKTPLKIQGIAPGSAVQLEVRKGGYESSLQLLNIVRAEERVVSVDLLRLTPPGNPAKKGP